MTDMFSPGLAASELHGFSFPSVISTTDNRISCAESLTARGTAVHRPLQSNVPGAGVGIRPRSSGQNGKVSSATPSFVRIEYRPTSEETAAGSGTCGKSLMTRSHSISSGTLPRDGLRLGNAGFQGPWTIQAQLSGPPET